MPKVLNLVMERQQSNSLILTRLLLLNLHVSKWTKIALIEFNGWMDVLKTNDSANVTSLLRRRLSWNLFMNEIK